jgi:phosphoribosylformylglycinamidine synthase
MKIRVIATLKPTVLDPQGKAVHHALDGLGFANVSSVRTGRVFDLVIDETDRGRVAEQVEAMGKRLLSNPVIEDFTWDIVEG